MKDYQQTWEGTSNGRGDGYGYGSGGGYGSGSGSWSGNGDGYGGGDGDGDGSGNGYIDLRRLFPISYKYCYLLEGQTYIQQVKICYDLHNASNQEKIDILVEWYEAVLIDKAT